MSRKKKDITYATPKDIVSPRTINDDIQDAEDVKHDTTKKGRFKNKPPKSKVCRKLKVAHAYGRWERENEHSSYPFWERFCTACGHKSVWLGPWKNERLASGGYRLIGFDLDARPPGYE